MKLTGCSDVGSACQGKLTVQGVRGIRFGGFGPPPWHRSRLSQPATPPGTEGIRQWRFRPSLSVRDQSSQVYVDPDYVWPSTRQQTADSDLTRSD